jgi:AcrR family transcriptional regulator
MVMTTESKVPHASRRTDPPAGEAASARERLLSAAGELFYREGIHTVGIDRVIERAGVAKASLYNTFGSKDELVRAYLETRRAATISAVMRAVEAHEDPRDRLLAVFDAQRRMVARPGFNGCAFSSATSEAHSDTVDAATADYRSWFRDLFTDLATAAGATDPKGLGRQLHLLYDGASQAARMDHEPAIAGDARAAAEALLDAARTSPRSSRKVAR